MQTPSYNQRAECTVLRVSKECFDMCLLVCQMMRMVETFCLNRKSPKNEIHVCKESRF